MSEPRQPPARTSLVGAVRHWGGFAASGAIAFATDAFILEMLVRFAGLSAFLARLVAIGCAMVVGWRAHRFLTFELDTAPSLREFLAYFAVAWVSAAVNYAVFAAILLWRPETAPLVALIPASLVAMALSYLGMRFGVFRKELAASEKQGPEA